MRTWISVCLLAAACTGCQSWIEIRGQVYQPGAIDGLALVDDEPLPSFEALGCVPLKDARVSFLDRVPSEQAALGTQVSVPDSMSDSRGYFELRRLDEGRRDYFASLRVEKPGYVTVARAFWVDAREEAFSWKVLLVPETTLENSAELTLQPLMLP